MTTNGNETEGTATVWDCGDCDPGCACDQPTCEECRTPIDGTDDDGRMICLDLDCLMSWAEGMREDAAIARWESAREDRA